MRPEQYVPLPEHEDARALLASCRFAVLDGDSGMGKTTIALRHLTASLPHHAPIYMPGSPLMSGTALNQSILFDLGKPYEGRSDHEIRLAVRDALLALAAENRPALVVIDDAHELADSALDELRSLDNLRACRLLLIGLAGLGSRVAQRSAIASRIDTFHHLPPLSLISSIELMKARFPLGEEALTLLAKHGGGSPRLLNRLAQATSAAATEPGEEVEAALEVIARLVPPAQPAEPGPPLRITRGKRDDAPVARTPKQKARKAA